MISQEMKDNPLLEEIDEGEQVPEERTIAETEETAPQETEHTAEVKGEGQTPEAINEFDWENYLDNYNLTPYQRAEWSGRRGEALLRKFPGETNHVGGPPPLAASVLSLYGRGAPRRHLDHWKPR